MHNTFTDLPLLDLVDYQGPLEELPVFLADIIGDEQVERSVIYWIRGEDRYAPLVPAGDFPGPFTGEEVYRLVAELEQHAGETADAPTLLPPGLQAYLGEDVSAIPLMRRARLYGVWFLPDLDEPEHRQAIGISPHLTIGLDRWQVTKRYEHQKSRLHGLLEAAELFASRTNMEEVLRYLVGELKNHAACAILAILLREGESLRIAAASGFEDPQMEGKTLSIDRGITGRAARTKQVQLANDVSQDPDYLSLGSAGIQSELAVPLVFHDELIGVLSAQARTPGFFTTEDQEYLLAVAELAAIAIRNARMFERLEAAREYLAKVMAGTGDAIYTIDMEGRIVSWNAGAEELYGYSTGEVLGADAGELLGGGQSDFDVTELVHHIRENDGRYQVEESTRQHRDGESLPVQSSYILVEDHRGEEIISITDTDLSAAKQITRLEVAQELISTVTHYVNNAVTPLNGRAQITEMKRTEANVDRLIEVALETTFKIQEVLKTIQEMQEYITTTYYNDTTILKLEDELEQKLKELEGEKVEEMGESSDRTAGDVGEGHSG